MRHVFVETNWVVAYAAPAHQPAVLVRAEQLRDPGGDDLVFCELDGDLQPWDKNGRSKQPLTELYDSARLWVYGDFAMESPVKHPTLPE